MSQIIFGSAQPSAEPKKLTFSQITENDLQKSTAEFLAEIYNRLGFDVTFLQTPGRRALQLSNTGKTDGEVFRIHSVGNIYKNLVRVPTPLISLTNYAFTLHKKYIVNTVYELNSVPRIGIVRGVIWAEKMVKGRQGVVFADNNMELARKLLKGSVDVALTNGIAMPAEFEKLNSSYELYTGAPINIIYVYHYLHKSHLGLVGDVDNEIKKMIKSNEIEDFIDLPYIAQK